MKGSSLPGCNAILHSRVAILLPREAWVAYIAPFAGPSWLSRRVTRFCLNDPTAFIPTLPSSHPVRRRPTHRGAGVVHGVQVERATVRTTWTPWVASARLCLGQWRTGWELPAHATTGPQSGTVPPPSRCRPIPRRRHCSNPRALSAVIDSWLPALSTRGRASAQPAGAGRRQERRRSAAGCLDEVEKPVTAQAWRGSGLGVSSTKP